MGIDGSRYFKLKWLSEPRVESTLDQPACTTAVDLVFNATVDAIVPVSEDILERKNCKAAFRMRYLLGLWNKTCSAPMIAPAEFFPKDYITEQKTAITNQYLLPIMYASDYAETGRKMLKMYYPEALEKPMPVNGWELARRMKLTVKRVHFPAGSDIQGRIYFDRTEVTVRDKSGREVRAVVEPMTILVNVDLCPTPEIENSTIVHECCHVYLDLRFFKLQMLSGKPFTSFTSRKRTRKRYSQNNSAIDWMELQAEKLPAYVLMEEGNTRRKIEELLLSRGGAHTPENIYWVMCQLADFYQVSKSMAKYRMIELGYAEAEGVYAYIDRMRVPDYGCAGTWERGITYAIALADAGALIRESADFAEALRTGAYTYVEGHFCLDMAPYVEFDYRRIKRLTAYARHHIEECCIAFAVNGRYANTSYEDAQAARKKEVKDKYQSRHSLDAEPDSKGRALQNSQLSSHKEYCP